MEKLNNISTGAFIRMRSLVDHQEGQGMVEYGLIIALVAIVLIGALGLLNDSLTTVFTTITTELNKTGT